MNSSNVSFVIPAEVIPIHKAMCGFGIIAAIENVGILLVLCSTKRLLRSSSLLIGLTIGHALNGLCHAILAHRLQSPSAYDLRGRLSCMLNIDNLFAALYQLLPVILVLVGIERLLAVGAPALYRAHCTSRRQWLVTAATFGVVVLSMAVHSLDAWLEPGPLIVGCAPPGMFGKEYAVYGIHGLAVLGGLAALVLTLIAVGVGRQRIKKLPTSSKSEVSRMKRQMRLTQCMLVVSCIDVIFVAFPNVIFFLYNVGLIEIPIIYAAYASLMYCIDSVLNIVAYLLFNRDFRRACFKLVSCGSVVSVEPMSAGQTTKQSRRT